MKDYRASGVQNIWLIDPIRRSANTLGARGAELVTGSQLAVPGTAVVLDLAVLFAQLDAAIARRKAAPQSL